MRAWLCYDMRTAPGGASSEALTAAAIEQVAWADDKGFDAVLLPEHHGAPDGYLSSPMMLGAAMAARTERIRFVMGCVLLPLHNPIRVAEDAALLDVISGGRLVLAAGLGYNPYEFAMFGIDRRRRVALLEEGIGVLRNGFTGEEFSYRERPVRIAPRVVRQGGPPIYVCGSVKAAARRAAQFGDGFFPLNPEIRQTYRDACAELGKPVGEIATYAGPVFIHVTEDPDRAWAQIAPHAAAEIATYGKWAEGANTTTPTDTPYLNLGEPDLEAIKQTGLYAVVTPEQCVDLVRWADDNDYLLNFKPMMGGLAPDMAWESLELFVDKVMPKVRV